MSEVAGFKSLWSALLAFFRRDIRSFMRKPSHAASSPAQQGMDLEGNSSPNAPPLAPLPPLLDPAQLTRVRYRREILDWRDDSIVRLGAKGAGVLNEFSKRVEGLLKAVSLWRLVWPKPANAILRLEFDKLVRSNIRNEALLAKGKLAELAFIQTSSIQEPPSINDDWPDRQLSCISAHGFRSANRNAILSDIAPLVMGDHGIVRMFQNQVVRIADELVRKVLL